MDCEPTQCSRYRAIDSIWIARDYFGLRIAI
jgi:hypothetical protein